MGWLGWRRSCLVRTRMMFEVGRRGSICYYALMSCEGGCSFAVMCRRSTRVHRPLSFENCWPRCSQSLQTGVAYTVLYLELREGPGRRISPTHILIKIPPKILLPVIDDLFNKKSRLEGLGPVEDHVVDMTEIGDGFHFSFGRRRRLHSILRPNDPCVAAATVLILTNFSQSHRLLTLL